MFLNGQQKNANAGYWGPSQGRLQSLNDLEFDQQPGFQANRGQMMAKEVMNLKQDNSNLQMCLYELQADRDKLRNAIRKLKVENGRLKAKVKRISDAAKSGKNTDDIDEPCDFSEIGEFLLIGGPKDPLDMQYTASVKDNDLREYKTGEWYMWYHTAEHFGDADAMNKLSAADDAKKAEEIVNKIKNFDQASWDAVKLQHFENYQRLKFEQNRALKCLLIKTAPLYLAIASQDKVYGTGWRKQRLEADKPQMWDGENLGGKILMKLREEFAAHHIWASADEEKQAYSAYQSHKQSIWKRMQIKKRPMSSATSYDDNAALFGEGYMSFMNMPKIRGTGRGRGMGGASKRGRR